MDVLLVRAGALGDLLLLRRSIAALRRAGHRVRLLAPAAGAALVGPGPGEVEALLPWDAPQTASILAGERAAGPLAGALAGSDLVIAWTRSEEARGALARVARRLVAHDPAPPVREAAGPDAVAGTAHVSHWLARPVAELGLDAGADPPVLAFTEDERAEADRRLAAGFLAPGFLALHPGSGSPSKNWPAGLFFELAARVTAAAHSPVARGPRERFLLALGPAERERGVGGAVPANGVVAREWPLRVLGAALARAGLFVGNDSGASHLAAAAGAPTLALFGPTDPAVWSPVGPRVRTVRTAGVAGVDEVARAALALRASTSGASGPPSG